MAKIQLNGKKVVIKSCYSIFDLLKKYKLDISKCFMVGDRKSDIDAASKVKCKSIFINRKYKEEKPKGQITQVYSFKKAVDVILQKG